MSRSETNRISASDYLDRFTVTGAGDEQAIEGPEDSHKLVGQVNAKLEPFETGGLGYDLDALAFNLESLQIDVEAGDMPSPSNSEELVDAIVAKYRAGIAETAKLKGVTVAELFRKATAVSRSLEGRSACV